MNSIDDLVFVKDIQLEAVANSQNERAQRLIWKHATYPTASASSDIIPN